jgi:hypothetical protein
MVMACLTPGIPLTVALAAGVVTVAVIGTDIMPGFTMAQDITMDMDVVP